MNRQTVFLQLFFYVLVFSGCTLLSVHKDPAMTEGSTSTALWLAPLTIGIAGSIYLAVAKRVKFSWLYGAPTIIFGLIVSSLFPSTFTRIAVLIVFVSLALLTVFSLNRGQRNREVNSPSS